MIDFIAKIQEEIVKGKKEGLKDHGIDDCSNLECKRVVVQQQEVQE